MTGDPIDPLDADVPGLLRGSCPLCLGPSRKLATHIDLFQGRGRGSFSVRGVVYCFGSGKLTTVRGDEFEVSGETEDEAITHPCSVCGKDAVGVAFQVARKWKWLVAVEVCTAEHTITNVLTGKRIAIPRPISHSCVGGGTMTAAPVAMPSPSIVQVPRPVVIPPLETPREPAVKKVVPVCDDEF